MIPVDEESKILIDDWQKLTKTQREAIKMHIKSYLQ